VEKNRSEEQDRDCQRQGPTPDERPGRMKVAKLVSKQERNQQENKDPTEVNLNGDTENLSNPDGRSHRLC
jgi:hypothetical protein